MTPDYFSALTGWRRFQMISPLCSVLVSVGAGHPWTQADIGPAFCAASSPIDHACPTLGCSCGYYAYKTWEDALAHAQGDRILARVDLWGRVAEHERGYRAERMRIAELFLAPGNEDRIDSLTARYQVPVSLLEGDVWTSVHHSGSSLSSLSPSLYGPGAYPQYNQQPSQPLGPLNATQIMQNHYNQLWNTSLFTYALAHQQAVQNAQNEAAMNIAALQEAKQDAPAQTDSIGDTICVKPPRRYSGIFKLLGGS